MKFRVAAVCLGFTVAGAVGCVGTDTDEDPDDTETTGFEMTVDIQDKTNVEGMRFTGLECGDDDPVFVEDRDLEEMTLPDARPEFVDDPFDEDSEHLFAHFHRTVDAGCWDVTVEPLDGDGQTIPYCEAATVQDIEVVEGETTEVLAVSQCNPPKYDDDKKTKPDDPDDGGVIEVAGTVNHPPKIKSVEALPSRTLECPATLELCADVVEPDADPVVFDWLQPEGPDPVAGPEETLFEQVGTKVEKCVEYELPDQTADYLFELTVFDYFMLEEDEPITAEQWYIRQGYGEIESSDTITVPVSVECPDDVLGVGEDKDDKKEKKDDKKEKKDDEKKKDEKYYEKDDDKKDAKKNGKKNGKENGNKNGEKNGKKNGKKK